MDAAGEGMVLVTKHGSDEKTQRSQGTMERNQWKELTVRPLGHFIVVSELETLVQGLTSDAEHGRCDSLVATGPFHRLVEQIFLHIPDSGESTEDGGKGVVGDGFAGMGGG